MLIAFALAGLLLSGGEAPPQAAPADSSCFQHRAHVLTVKCAACHDEGHLHLVRNIRAPETCRGCHHSPAQKATCVECHVKAAGAPPALAPNCRLVKAVSSETPAAFRHEAHAAVKCTQCHASGPVKTVEAECTSCHANHHAAGANCVACHAGAREIHDRTAHDGCRSCHADALLPAVAESRTLCLTCHEDRRDHQTGRVCASCHAVPPHTEVREAAAP